MIKKIWNVGLKAQLSPVASSTHPQHSQRTVYFF